MSISPFEAGRAVSGNIGRGIRQARDTSMLDQVLETIAGEEDLEKAQGMIGQVLSRISPERQPQAAALLGSKLGALQERKTQSEHRKIAEDFAKRDDEYSQAIAKVLSTSLSAKEKESLIKSIQILNPTRQTQQQRLQRQDISRNLNQKIKELQAEKKNLPYTRDQKERQAALDNQIRTLQSQRDLLYNQLNPEEKSTQEAESPYALKEVFNPENPKHRKRFEELKSLYNGDLEQVNVALSEEFR